MILNARCCPERAPNGIHSVLIRFNQIHFISNVCMVLMHFVSIWLRGMTTIVGWLPKIHCSLFEILFNSRNVSWQRDALTTPQFLWKLNGKWFYSETLKHSCIMKMSVICSFFSALRKVMVSHVWKKNFIKIYRRKENTKCHDVC